MSFEQLTYERVELRPVMVPLRRPIIARIGSFEAWPLILIDLYTAEDVVGRAYVTPYTRRNLASLLAALGELARARAGQPVAPLDDFAAARRASHLVGWEGVSLIAASGLDMAAWDALAKASDLPLAALLGATPGPVRAYNTSGLWLGPISELGAEAAAMVEEGGFQAIKLRLGRERLDDDFEAIEAVRDAVGEDVRLMTDFNQGLTLGDALHRCQALDDEEIYWFEEPLVYDDLAGYARLARALRTPVQLGENFYGPRSMQAAIRAEAGAYMMPDLGRIGGVTGWLRAAALAEAAGIEMSSHLFPEVSCHVLRATPSAHWLEWENWAHPILAETLTVKDGMVHPRDVPGTGLEWDESAVAHYRCEV